MKGAQRLSDSVALVQDHSSAQEVEAYRRAVGRILAETLLAVMNPLYREHPALKPGDLD